MFKLTSMFLGALALIGSATTLTACDGVDDASSPRTLAISAHDLAALPAGESLVVDSEDARTVHLDPSAGSLDLSRVALHLGEQRLSLQQALESAPELQGFSAAELGDAAITIREHDGASDDEQVGFRQAAAPGVCVEFAICQYGVCVWVEVCVNVT